MLSVIGQIILLDIIFSFDSILTAIGLTEQVLLMIIAVVISMIIMMIFSGRISDFIQKHPTLEILALSFLILIGFMLIIESIHYHIPKGYIYFAVFFSLIVEVVNMRVRKKREPVPLSRRYTGEGTTFEKVFSSLCTQAGGDDICSGIQHPDFLNQFLVSYPVKKGVAYG